MIHFKKGKKVIWLMLYNSEIKRFMKNSSVFIDLITYTIRKYGSSLKKYNIIFKPIPLFFVLFKF